MLLFGDLAPALVPFAIKEDRARAQVILHAVEAHLRNERQQLLAFALAGVHDGDLAHALVDLRQDGHAAKPHKETPLGRLIRMSSERVHIRITLAGLKTLLDAVARLVLEQSLSRCALECGDIAEAPEVAGGLRNGVVIPDQLIHAGHAGVDVILP